MSIVVFNPTNEEFKPQYIGELTIIKAGAKLKLDDARARHILNEYGIRGLCRLEYGDDEEKIGKAGIERNVEFKRRQIATYNQQNAARRQENMSYIDPPEQIKTYAEELGFELTQPYIVQDDINKKLADKDKQLSDAMAQVNELSSLVKRLLDAQTENKKLDPDKETEEQKEIENNRLEYKKLSSKTLEGWIKNNKDRIGAWPEENLSEIRSKYGEFYKKELKI